MFRTLEFKAGEVARKAENDKELAEALTAFPQCRGGINAASVGGVLRMNERAIAPEGKLIKIKTQDGRHVDWKIWAEGDMQEEEDVPF